MKGGALYLRGVDDDLLVICDVFVENLVAGVVFEAKASPSWKTDCVDSWSVAVFVVLEERLELVPGVCMKALVAGRQPAERSEAGTARGGEDGRSDDRIRLGEYV